MRRLWPLLLATLACASTPGRFEDAPIVWYADDARDVPQPHKRRFAHIQYFSDILGLRRWPRGLELRDLEPAHNTNALDEVPNSTWFTNRIGVHRIEPERAARGPVVDGPPELPLVVVSGKSGGRNPGFLAEDASGRKFLIKFDRPENPGMQTGTGAIVNRIFWAIGYNVPQDTLFQLRRGDVRLAPAAKLVPKTGKERTMTVDDVDAIFAAVPRLPDGSFRASASQLLAGVPLGGPPAEGVRKDDPNDVVAHEHRRELRGLRVFAAWLSHTDVKEDNFLDMYVEEHDRKFVRHYLIDFGEALGAHQAEADRLEDGFEFVVDWEKNGLALLSLGLWKRPWEDQRQTPWPEIGAFSAELFDPETWREAYPFWPFFAMDPADAYWAAKIVMRFDRPVLTAIVAEGRFSADASAYLVDTLLARARAIGRAYLESVTPLDAFHVAGDRLCAYDLGVVYGLADTGTVERVGRHGVEAAYRVDARGKVCLPLPDDDEYTVARLRVRRGRERRPIMQVHFVGGATPHVLGIVRSERGPCMKGRGPRRCR